MPWLGHGCGIAQRCAAVMVTALETYLEELSAIHSSGAPATIKG
jgi:hypothetical protein